MSEQLSPEQRAYKALADNRSRFGYRHIPNRDRELASDIAAAIRAAETAAVEAERDRCAKIAKDAAANSERGEHPRHEHIGAIGYECACGDIAEAIRATPTTEATHG